MISVILPTKDEEKAIEEIVKKCRDAGIQEIIVVDDSKDKTPEIAERLGCKVLRNVKGYGNAYIEGLKHASGEIVVMMDADGSYDPLEIKKLVKPILEGKADLVIGSRFRGKIMPKAMSWHHRYIGNPLLTKMTNFLFKTNLSDVHSGFRAVRKDFVSKLNLMCPGMEFATEFILKAVVNGLRITEVPINYYPRKGESKLRSFRDGWRHLRLILTTSPGQLFLVPSIFITLLGILISAYVLLLNPIRTHTLILGTLLVLVGIQIFFFGISGKLYSKQIGFRREDRITKIFSNYSLLEKIMFFGAFLFISGIILGYRVLSAWFKVGFGSLSELNTAILSMLFIFSGLQIIFSSIFISVFLLVEKDKGY